MNLIGLHSDGHVHTRLCNHAAGEMEEYVQAAVYRGLKEIIFLEHMETGICYDEATWLTEEKFAFYRKEGLRLREQYRDQIDIKLGIELGYNRDALGETLARLQANTWDRIGISCHFLRIPGEKQHINILSRRQDNIERATRYGTEELMTCYLDRLTEAVRLLPGDVLCHLDAGLRYASVNLTTAHYQQVEKLLHAVKEQGMKLEINTSGFRMRNEPFPSHAILKIALRLDIPLVAGSDAHRPEDVGGYFSRLPAYINSAVSP